MHRITLFASFASCLVVLSGCDKQEEAPAVKTAKPPPAPEKPKIGIDAPGNDPAIVALAKKALACKWEGSEEKAFASFASDCAEYTAWKDEKDAFADGKGEATLVAFLEDPDEKVRWLGAQRLSSDRGLLKDDKLGARVLAVAEKSKAAREMDPLGSILGHTVLTDPALLPRIKTLATSGNINLRNGIMSNLLPSNPDNEDVFAMTREAAKSTGTPDDKNVARTALGAFSKLQTDKPARCEVYLENIENADVDHAGDAMQWLTLPTAHCQAQFDAVLKSLDARVKAKTATSSFFAISLGRICDATNAAKPAEVKQALGLAHKLAEDKTLEGRVRALAIDASAACDPKGGKGYAGKFKKETDQDIKDTVTRLTRKK